MCIRDSLEYAMAAAHEMPQKRPQKAVVRQAASDKAEGAEPRQGALDVF